MRMLGKIGWLVPLTLLLMVLLANTGQSQEMNRTFDAKELVDVNTVSGDLTVKVGDDDKIVVELEQSVRPRDSFEPRIKERGNVLEISEQFHGSSNGGTYWTITVPKSTRIRFSTASGSLRIDGLVADVDANLASGDVDLYNCSGDMDVRTASGNIELDSCSGRLDASSASGSVRAIRCQGDLRLSAASGNVRAIDSQGEFDLSSASGSVRASGIQVDQRSSFSSASGSAYVTLAKSAEHDLVVSSASGRAILDYDGNPVKGYFEFVARDREGRIDAPYDFDDEVSFRHHGDRYVRKSFAMEGEAPEIRVETASGVATLKK